MLDHAQDERFALKGTKRLKEYILKNKKSIFENFSSQIKTGDKDLVTYILRHCLDDYNRHPETLVAFDYADVQKVLEMVANDYAGEIGARVQEYIIEHMGPQYDTWGRLAMALCYTWNITCKTELLTVATFENAISQLYPESDFQDSHRLGSAHSEDSVDSLQSQDHDAYYVDGTLHNSWDGTFPTRTSTHPYIKHIAESVAKVVTEKYLTATELLVLLIGGGAGLVIDAMLDAIRIHRFTFHVVDIAEQSKKFPTNTGDRQRFSIVYHKQDATEYLAHCRGVQYDVIIDDAYGSKKVLPFAFDAYHPWHRVVECLKTDGLLVINYCPSLKRKRGRRTQGGGALENEQTCFKHLGLKCMGTEHSSTNSVLVFRKENRESENLLVSVLVLSELIAAADRRGGRVIILDQGGGFDAWVLYKTLNLPVVNYMDARKAFKETDRHLVVIDRCRTSKPDELAAIIHVGTLIPSGCSLLPLNQNLDNDVMNVCGFKCIQRGNPPMYEYEYEASQTHADLKNPWYLQWAKDRSLVRAEPLELVECAVQSCTCTTWCQPLCAQHTQEVYGVRLGHSAVLKCVGLFATRVFRKGDLIVPYMGRDEVRLTMHDGQIVHSAYTMQRAGNQTVCDGAVSRGLGAMANHSSQSANARQGGAGDQRRVAQELRQRGVWLHARDLIKPGEEVLLNYGPDASNIIVHTTHKTVERPAFADKLIENRAQIVQVWNGDGLLSETQHDGSTQTTIRKLMWQIGSDPNTDIDQVHGAVKLTSRTTKKKNKPTLDFHR